MTLKIMLVSNHSIPKTVLMAEHIAERLKERGLTVEIDDCLRPAADFTEIELIIVLGGDGTIVRAARQYLAVNAPILGVNMGTVGFLSNIEADELDDYLDRFINKDFTIDERMMLEVDIFRNSQRIQSLNGLNELCIRSQEAHLIDLDMRIGGQNYGAYRADGLIVATPTGSTAYSLSCGGPIVDPELDAFILTPIASYLLVQRPLVISAAHELCLKLIRGPASYVSMDGQVKVNVKENDIITIKKAGQALKLVNLKPREYFATVDNRLKRNKEER